MKYKGENCAGCGEAFTAEDDVVVCPDCGSPHHRDCYVRLGRCANIAFHASGEKWKPKGSPFREKPVSPITSNVCPSCKFPNAAGETKCSRCGTPLDTADAGAAAADRGENSEYADTDIGMMKEFLGFDPEEDMGGATLSEVTQFVGSNTLYYIPIFKHMKDVGSRISFNLSCLIFPYFYFANRKMWGWAVFSALISVILNLPAVLLKFADSFTSIKGTEKFISAVIDNKSSLESLDSYFGMIGWCTSIAFCLFGNWLYYRYTLRSLKRLKSAAPDKKPSSEMLAAAGGVKPVNIIFITLVMFAIGIAGLLVSLKILYS
ncbi:MAG: hypothetical protein IKO47_09105 [Ruminococcus sp.]|nr:hypothetical protein [Ruminococcus sp.]